VAIGMAKRRRVSNLLALAILTLLGERPMHPYEIATLLRERGKAGSIKINWGSLYTVVANLEKYGFIEATHTAREGRRPERTVYRITAEGSDELRDWLRELIGTPEKEYPRFAAALSEMGALPPDEVVGLLRRRLTALDADVAAMRDALTEWSKVLPRLFLIESEYELALREAETAWVRSLYDQMRGGTLEGVDAWREFHETGRVPAEFAGLDDRVRQARAAAEAENAGAEDAGAENARARAENARARAENARARAENARARAENAGDAGPGRRGEEAG
jgi:DNA-binding PadR family transcriptional regulator